MKTNRTTSNTTIYNAIRQIAFHKIVDPHTNSVINTKKIRGYVVKVNLDGDSCGTVDVQEKVNPADRVDDPEYGLHKGVFLSAIQNNENGIFIIPFLYSDVIIETDPVTLREYVTQYSHADKIQVDAHNEIVIGVTETKELTKDDDSPDYNELEKTGVRSNTKYSPTSIINVVAKSDDTKEQSKIEITADQILSEHDKSQILLDASKILAKYNATEIVIKDKEVHLGKDGSSEPAVLGNQLATFLLDWLSALTQMVTPTMMGPQPPANLAKFITLQAKMNSYKSAITGILSKTVKVAE